LPGRSTHQHRGGLRVAAALLSSADQPASLGKYFVSRDQFGGARVEFSYASINFFIPHWTKRGLRDG